MTTTPTAALADFLDSKARAVRAIEAQAEEIIHGTGDQSGYEKAMRQKAEMLAALADEAKTFISALPSPLPAQLADAANQHLGDFSANAANALRIGSVFYMSALLYPDEHKPGEPNNLELYAAEVRSWG